MASLLTVRKVAVKDSPHTVVNDPTTGRAIIINTETGREESRPLLGVCPVGDLPEKCTVSTGFVESAVSEGWASYVNERVVFRPSGPADNKWGTPPHAFVHADAIVFHFIEGDVRYDVTHQPDKYVAKDKTFGDQTIDTYPDFDLDDEPVTDAIYEAGKTRVDWFYGLQRRLGNSL